MAASNKVVRKSVSLPARVASRVNSIARSRKLSANRVLLELIETGLDAEEKREREFFELANRFRAATDPGEVERLGDELGRMVFGA